jgi:hypothetical protein
MRLSLAIGQVADEQEDHRCVVFEAAEQLESTKDEGIPELTSSSRFCFRKDRCGTAVRDARCSASVMPLLLLSPIIGERVMDVN